MCLNGRYLTKSIWQIAEALFFTSSFECRILQTIIIIIIEWHLIISYSINKCSAFETKAIKICLIRLKYWKEKPNKTKVFIGTRIESRFSVCSFYSRAVHHISIKRIMILWFYLCAMWRSISIFFKLSM